MKVRLGDVRTLIREEYLQGVPEWQLRQDTSEFVDKIRDRVKRFILLNKSQTALDQREAIATMNQVCDDLEEKVYEVLENQLFNFTRKV